MNQDISGPTSPTDLALRTNLKWSSNHGRKADGRPPKGVYC